MTLCRNRIQGLTSALGLTAENLRRIQRMQGRIRELVAHKFVNAPLKPRRGERRAHHRLSGLGFCPRGVSCRRERRAARRHLPPTGRDRLWRRRIHYPLRRSVLGGAGNWFGAMMGGLLMRAVPTLLDELNVSPTLGNAIFGLGLIIAVIKGPEGLAGLFDDIIDRLTVNRQETP